MLPSYRPRRRRLADRLAAVLIAGLAIIPAVGGTEIARLVLSLGACDLGCAVFLIMGWLVLVLSVAGFGLAWSIWVGTRLGRVVGFGASVVGLLLYGQATVGLLRGEVLPKDLVIVVAITLAFALTAGLTLMGTLDWLADVRADRR